MHSSALAVSGAAWRDSPWPQAARTFLGSIATAGQHPGGLLTVGTPDHEPWHLTAHLRDEAELHGLATLAPTLVRRTVPPGAPPHLRVDLDRLGAAARGATVLVVSPSPADELLLSRVEDARRHGATLLALTTSDPDLTGIAHDALATGDVADPGSAPFDVVSHLVSCALSLPGRSAGRLRRGGARRGWR